MPLATRKAMSALSDHIKKGEVKSEDVVLFLHTGGNPALFAYVDELDHVELNTHLTFD